MKTKDFACHLIALVLALLATTELAMGAVKGKLNPVRAGINTRTTYSLFPSTGSKNRPAAFCLAGADCEISEEAGKTIVKVKNKNGVFEAVEFTDENDQPISVDWSNIMIFVGDGFFIDEYEGRQGRTDEYGEPIEAASEANHGVCYIGGQPTPGSQQTYGTCTITMTGGNIYGIRGGGYAESEKENYGCVYGNVVVNISGGTIHDLSNVGCTYIPFPEYGAHGVIFGTFTGEMTGGSYTNTTPPSVGNVKILRNSENGDYQESVTECKFTFTGVNFTFQSAIPQGTQNDYEYVYGNGANHTYVIKSITPDPVFPEAGTAHLACTDAGCTHKFDFEFSTNTWECGTSNNPTNIIAKAEPTGIVTQQPTCCTSGSQQYILGLTIVDPTTTNNQQTSKEYRAILPAVPNKHAWDSNDVCTNCGEVKMVEGYDVIPHEIFGPDQTLIIREEEYRPRHLVEADLKAKLSEEIKKAIGNRRFTLYQDLTITGELVANNTSESQLTFDLRGHKLTVPGIRTKKMSELTVKSGQLVTKYIQREGSACNIKVARSNGASILYDLEDDGTAYIQDSEVEAVGGNGIDAQFTRSYSYTLTDKWQALYLPFPVTLTNEMLADCDYALVETSKAGTSKSEAIYITKQATGTTLAANTPYLIRPKAAGDRVINVQDVKISKAESKGFDCSTRSGSDDATLEFKGTYEPINELKTKGYLFMNTNGNISGAKDNTSTLKPYRWYAQVKSGSLAKVSIFTIGEDDEEDGIQWIEEVEAGTNNNAPTYDLSGRRVGENRRPGLYIRGGKKVVRQ